MRSSRNLSCGLASLMLSLIIILLCASPVSLNTTQSGDKKGVFNDDDLKEEKVGGKWGISNSPDTNQLDDPSVPVVVSGMRIFSGKGKYLGITKIKEVSIINRTSKIVNSLRLRWTVINPDEPEKDLSEGLTPPVGVQVEANSSREVEIPALYFNRIIKSLTKNGELYGNFQVMIGVQEVGFTDGSVWRRKVPISFLKTPW